MLSSDQVSDSLFQSMKRTNSVLYRPALGNVTADFHVVRRLI